MSDRDDLDTLDLDLAFDRLCADVDSRTRPRGAGRAIGSVSRRRFAGAGVALVVVAVLAGVLVSTLGLPGGPSVPQVAAPAGDPLPEPHTFDATTFNEAANGWTSGWTEAPSPVPTNPPCVPYDGDLPEPLNSSSTEFRAGARIGATHTVERFDSSERASQSHLGKTFSESCRGEVVQLRDEIWSGGQSVSFSIKTDRQTFYEIMILHETKVAVLRVAGAGKLPEDVRKQLVIALLADLRT